MKMHEVYFEQALPKLCQGSLSDDFLFLFGFLPPALFKPFTKTRNPQTPEGLESGSQKATAPLTCKPRILGHQEAWFCDAGSRVDASVALPVKRVLVHLAKRGFWIEFDVFMRTKTSGVL